MRCPFCKANEDQVVDSREGEGGTVIRRRRRCKVCRKRYTTYEKIEDAVKLSVIKRDGRRETYERSKILNSLRRACTKLDISDAQIEQLVDDVEGDVFANFDREVRSQFIGERTAERLRLINQVAYVRFASVYRKFTDVTEFIREAEQVLYAGGDAPGQQMLFEALSRLTQQAQMARGVSSQAASSVGADSSHLHGADGRDALLLAAGAQPMKPKSSSESDDTIADGAEAPALEPLAVEAHPYANPTEERSVPNRGEDIRKPPGAASVPSRRETLAASRPRR